MPNIAIQSDKIPNETDFKKIADAVTKVFHDLDINNEPVRVTGWTLTNCAIDGKVEKPALSPLGTSIIVEMSTESPTGRIMDIGFGLTDAAAENLSVPDKEITIKITEPKRITIFVGGHYVLTSEFK